MRRNIGLILLSLSVCLPLSSCGNQVESELQTVVSENSVNQRLTLLNQRFTPDQLCDDYKLFKLILRDIHYDAPAQDLKQVSCPTSYRDFAIKVQSELRATQDLHTTVSFGYGLDATSYPIIRSCVPEAACRNLIGSQLMAFPSSLRTQFYALATDTLQKGHIFELKAVGGVPLSEQLRSFRTQFQLPNGSDTYPYFFSEFLLKRGAIDSRSKEDFTAQLWEINSKTAIDVTLSYIDRQTIFPSPTVSFMSNNLEFARTFDCSTQSPDSNDLIGSCVTTHGKGVFWLSEWPQWDEDFAVVLQKHLLWLADQTPADLPLIFDLSGNQGGSPITVGHFMCRVGNQATLNAMKSYQITTRPWPSAFDLGARTILTSSLSILVNGDLIFRDSDWNSSWTGETSKRQRFTGFLDRANLTTESCAQLRLPELESRKWILTTNGQEFSASEDFLLLAQKSQGKFINVGFASAGGVGAPSWVILPETKTRVRISPSRMLFNNQLVTEKVGVKPTARYTPPEAENVFLIKSLHALDHDADFNPTLEPNRPVFKTLLPLNTGAFQASTFLGSWRTSCLSVANPSTQSLSAIDSFEFTPDAISFQRQEFSDAQCRSPGTVQVKKILDPLQKVRAHGRESLFIPSILLWPLDFGTSGFQLFKRPFDSAIVKVCQELTNCPLN